MFFRSTSNGGGPHRTHVCSDTCSTVRLGSDSMSWKSLPFNGESALTRGRKSSVPSWKQLPLQSSEPSWKQLPLTSSEPSWKRLKGIDKEDSGSSWKVLPLNKPLSLCPSVQRGETSQDGSSWKALALGSDTKQGRAQPSATCRHEVQICPIVLEMLSHEAAKAADTHYRKRGRDRVRVEEVMSTTYCQKEDCGICCKTLSVESVVAMLDLWHKLSDEAQTQYLASQYEAPVHGAPETCSTRPWTDYKMCGVPVCRDGFCAVLGTCHKTLTKRVNREVDMRHTHQASRLYAQHASRVIDFFFIDLYHTSSEDLPEHEHKCEDVDKSIADDMEAPLEVLCPKLEETFSWTPEASIAETVAHLVGPTSDAPLRHLSPGTVVSLYWQFLAWFDATDNLCRSGQHQAPSWTSFWRSWTYKWCKMLKFRKTSQHKECNSCFDFRETVRKRGLSVAAKMEVGAIAVPRG